MNSELGRMWKEAVMITLFKCYCDFLAVLQKASEHCMGIVDVSAGIRVGRSECKSHFLLWRESCVATGCGLCFLFYTPRIYFVCCQPL